MMEYCVFEIPGRYKMCMALTKKNCDGCKFYKTRAQLAEDQERAAEILRKKGLSPVEKGGIMTTRPLKIKNEYNFIFTKPEGDTEQ